MLVSYILIVTILNFALVYYRYEVKTGTFSKGMSKAIDVNELDDVVQKLENIVEAAHAIDRGAFVGKPGVDVMLDELVFEIRSNTIPTLENLDETNLRSLIKSYRLILPQHKCIKKLVKTSPVMKKHYKDLLKEMKGISVLKRIAVRKALSYAFNSRAESM